MASTKTHLSQIVALELLALYLAQLRGTLPAADARHLFEKMAELPGLIRRFLNARDAVAAVAGRFTKTRDFFFLGRHVGFPVALEGRSN